MNGLNPCRCGSGDVRWCQISHRPYCGDCNQWGGVNFGIDADAVKAWNKANPSEEYAPANLQAAKPTETAQVILPVVAVRIWNSKFQCWDYHEPNNLPATQEFAHDEQLTDHATAMAEIEKLQQRIAQLEKE